MAQAPATLVLALEYVPDTLHARLTAQLMMDENSAAAACHHIENQLFEAVRCMGLHELSHFDVDFHNVLVDGQHIYVSDFGLAASRRFEITSIEGQFLDHTARHDLAYVVTELTNTVVTTLAVSGGPAARNAYLRRCAGNGATPGLTARVAEVVRRYAPVAEVMNEFYWRLHEGKPTTPYPAEQIERSLTASGLGC